MSRILSGIQPTGGMHLGRYFGAVANWVRLQDAPDRPECLFGVVDYHAMTAPYEPEALRRQTNELLLDLLACGLDPAKCTLFQQSRVPEHAELCWLFTAITPYAWLRKMTQFKDKSEHIEAQGISHSTGLLVYPVLQAADILIYKATRVPVGQDQSQHLELARDVARTFNARFGNTFPEPEAIFSATPKILSPADPTKKMSSSLGPKHTIGVFEEEGSIRKKVASAVTDTGTPAPGEALSPGVEGLLTLLRACGDAEGAAAFEARFADGDRRYAPLKAAVADAVCARVEPMRKRRRELASDPAEALALVTRMSARARSLAAQTLAEARDRMGLPASA
jgi:tryptophanyl-tRNA synthetase